MKWALNVPTLFSRQVRKVVVVDGERAQTRLLEVEGNCVHQRVDGRRWGRRSRRRQRQREPGEGPRYDEEYYNNLISQEQQRQTRG